MALGWAVVHGTVTRTTRLPNNASIFRAELYAISLALAVIRRGKEKNFIIFSDSMSSLEAISGFKLEIDIVQNIVKDYTHLANSGKIIILCWIPSHVNIHGNERADTAAKSALSLPITNMKLPARELIPCVSKFCLNEWQDDLVTAHHKISINFKFSHFMKLYFPIRALNSLSNAAKIFGISAVEPEK